MKQVATVCLYAIIILCCTYISHENCICPTATSWKHNVTHHEFCGKEMSGKSCIENARYNCTKGTAKALFWDDCKEWYGRPYCSPTDDDGCVYPLTQAARKTVCLAQRACITKGHADRIMISMYGKTSLRLSKS
jgi:hypothetical protein